MTKITKFLVLILPISFFFTSCIDYVQSITYKAGRYQIYEKITFSKALTELAEVDSEDVFNEIYEDYKDDYLPKNAKAKPINTELEAGAEFSYEINDSTWNATEQSFLPKFSINKCYIPFSIGNYDSLTELLKSEDTETQGMMAAMFLTAKCRVLISKNITPHIYNAYFESYNDEDYSIPVYDYGQSYCLEIPFILLCDNETYDFDRIVVIVN